MEEGILAVEKGESEEYQFPAADDVAVEPPSYTDVLSDYVADAWGEAKESYLDHDMSGIDRAQDAVASTVAEYTPELENEYTQAVADGAVEFGRSFGQAMAGAFTSPAALYDAVQEWKDSDAPPVSPYVHIEAYRDGDGSVAETAGKAAGFATGAVAGVQYPVLFLAGAAHSARHLAERAAHRYLRDRLWEDDDMADVDVADEDLTDDLMDDLPAVRDAAADAAVDGYVEETLAA